MAEPIFLTLGEVVKIHLAQVERYGGPSAIRDLALLQSAVAMPGASYGKEWLHRDLYEMAAAYAFHISQDQPFIDGNKRTALTCTLVFGLSRTERRLSPGPGGPPLRGHDGAGGWRPRRCL